MHVALSTRQQDLRSELTEYFASLVTPERRRALAAASGEFGDAVVYKEVIRELGRDGWLGIGWPTEYGGQKRAVGGQLIFTRLAARARGAVPSPPLHTVGPPILRVGTAQQHE